MASLRQLVEFKGAVQYIHTCTSDYPLKQFGESPKALYQTLALLFPPLVERQAQGGNNDCCQQRTALGQLCNIHQRGDDRNQYCECYGNDSQNN